MRRLVQEYEYVTQSYWLTPKLPTGVPFHTTENEEAAQCLALSSQPSAMLVKFALFQRAQGLAHLHLPWLSASV